MYLKESTMLHDSTLHSLLKYITEFFFRNIKNLVHQV